MKYTIHVGRGQPSSLHLSYRFGIVLYLQLTRIKVWNHALENSDSIMHDVMRKSLYEN
jgi:hypothetical protein